MSDLFHEKNKKKNPFDPSLWIELNSVNAAEPLRRDILLLIIDESL